MNFFLHLSFILLVPSVLFGQVTAQKVNNVVVKDQNDRVLKFPWAGGLNAPQFSEIDLNADGILDLFIFDREGSKVLTFINGGTKGKVDYTYAPEYEGAFPPMVEFALLVDYNNDSKQDIFTHDGGGGIRVFKNVSTPSSLSFVSVTPTNLKAYYNPGISANLYCSRLDIPAIVDVDNDGDIDILSFDNASTTVNFFENYAADSGSTDIFRYHLTTGCWGHFAEDALSNVVSLNKSCPKVKSKNGNKHSGSTILAFDPDGDGDKDILLGDVTYPDMIFLENGGSSQLANMTSQTTNFPSNKKIEIQVFPAAYNLDVNNDGLKDLLIAPNTTNNIENVHGIWYYTNTGSSSTANYTFVQNDFLQGEMIESGTGAYPVFFDYNKDGLQDLVIGNLGVFNGASNQISKLLLYKNTGTKNNPQFKLVDQSFAGLDTINLNTLLATPIPTFNAIPTFVDLTNDGSMDMMIGDYNGRIHFFINYPVNEISKMKIQNIDFLGIDVGQYASPQLFDLDGDGLQDLLIGNKDGYISYYHNEGTSVNFDFVFKTDKLGKVRTRLPLSYYGYNQPMFFNADQDVYLICGSDGGYLYYYNNIRNNIDGGTFNLVDSMYLGIDVGERSHIAVDDIDDDGFLEFIIGNNAGGVNYFETDYVLGIDEPHNSIEKGFDLRIQNLDKNTIRIIVNNGNSNSNANLFLYNVSGQLLHSGVFKDIIDLSTSSLNNGMYFISVESEGFVENRKFIKQR